MAIMKAKITPTAEYSPKSLIGLMGTIIKVINPTAVVKDVKRVASPTSLKVVLMAFNFS